MILKAAIFSTLLFLCACGVKETLTPFTEVQTTAEVQGKHPELTIMSGNFTFDDISVDNPVGKIPVPFLGTFVQNLAGLFADIFVILNDDWEVDQETQFIEVPEIDEDYIVGLELRSLNFRIIPNSGDRGRGMVGRLTDTLSNKRPSLDFIEKIEIYVATEEMLSKKQSLLLASYTYDEEKLEKCLQQCIKMDIKEDLQGGKENLVPYLVGQTKLYVFPKVEINKTPKANFRIKGNIDFRLKVKLPF